MRIVVPRGVEPSRTDRPLRWMRRWMQSLCDSISSVATDHYAPAIGVSPVWPSKSIEFGLNPDDLIVLRNHSNVGEHRPRRAKLFVVGIDFPIGEVGMPVAARVERVA